MQVAYKQEYLPNMLLPDANKDKLKELADSLEDVIDEDFLGRISESWCETYKWVRRGPDEEPERLTHWTSGGRVDRSDKDDAIDEAVFGLLDDPLGSGNFSRVFVCPWDDTKAIKLGMGSNYDGDIWADGWLHYAAYCIRAGINSNPILANVYGIEIRANNGFFVALLDRYHITQRDYRIPLHESEDCDLDDLMKCIKAIICGYENMPDCYNSTARVHPEYIEAAHKLRQSEGFPSCNDLHGENIMLMRATDERPWRISITDPTSWEYSRSAKEVLQEAGVDV